jgi:PEGA domain
MRMLAVLFVVASLIPSTNLFAADNPPPQRKTAIIVENRAGEQFNDKVSVLEDLLGTRISGKGYSVLSRDVTVNALKSYSSSGITVSQKSTASGSAHQTSHQALTTAETNHLQSEQHSTGATVGTSTGTDDGWGGGPYNDNYKDASASTNHDRSASVAVNSQSAHMTQQGAGMAENKSTDSTHIAVTPDTTALDDALNNNTSALRLAQTLGADFILIPAITSYGTDKKTYNGDGINTVNVTHTLRVSYKIVEAAMGGTLRGGVVVASRTERQSGNLQSDNGDLVNQLLDDAATQLSDLVAKNAETLPTDVAKNRWVTFSVACTMADPRQQPIMIPAPQLTSDKRLAKTQPVPVEAMDVTVELDGVAIGSAPGDLKASPGLHKIRLSREGFADWTRTINVYDGETLRVALQMSDDGYARWKDTTDFLTAIDANRKLSDAEAQRIQGLATFFSNSHYRVDTKENTKSDHTVIVK